MSDQPKKRLGRPPHVPPLKHYNVTMTEAQAKLVRMWGRGDLSAGLRWLIQAASVLVRRAEADPPRNSG